MGEVRSRGPRSATAVIPRLRAPWMSCSPRIADEHHLLGARQFALPRTSWKKASSGLHERASSELVQSSSAPSRPSRETRGSRWSLSMFETRERCKPRSRRLWSVSRQSVPKHHVVDQGQPLGFVDPLEELGCSIPLQEPSQPAKGLEEEILVQIEGPAFRRSHRRSGLAAPKAPRTSFEGASTPRRRGTFQEHGYRVARDLLIAEERARPDRRRRLGFDSTWPCRPIRFSTLTVKGLGSGSRHAKTHEGRQPPPR